MVNALHKFCIERLKNDIEWREKGLKAELESLAGTPEQVFTLSDSLIRQKAQLELLLSMGDQS